MQGTGTQLDPYIITTPADFYSLSTLGGTNVYCELGSDIDMNYADDPSNYTSLPFFFKELRANGHKIRNISISAANTNIYLFKLCPDEYHVTSIYDLVIENMDVSAQKVHLFGKTNSVSSTVKLNNCSFALHINQSETTVPSNYVSLLHGAGIKIELTLCNISLTGIWGVQMCIFCNDTINKSHISVDITFNTGISSSVSRSAISYKTTMSDTYFTGTIHSAAANNNFFGTTDVNASNSYFALTTDNISCCFYYGSYISTCFLDVEITGNAQVVTSSGNLNLKSLTTAQCKNAAYLQSIGFNCEEA